MASPNPHKPLLQIVGGSTLPDEADPQGRERREALNAFFQGSWGLVASRLFPNFSFDSWLDGPTGFAAQFRANAPFDQSATVCDKFGVIMFAEVERMADWRDEELGRFQAIMERCLPVHSHAPPTLNDSPGGGWHPALGPRGCLIGLYEMKEESVAEGTLSHRWFLGCRTTLPRQTLDDMQSHDQDVHWGNVVGTGALRRLEDPLPAAQRGKRPAEAQVVLFRDHMGRASRNENCRRLATENARRLLWLAAELTGLKLRRPARQYPAVAGAASQAKATPANPTASGADFLQPDEGVEHQLLEPAVGAWPKGVPVPSFFRFPASPAEGALTPTPALRGFPLGKALALVKQQSPQKFAAFVDDVIGARLLERPMAAHEDLLTEYNTFAATPGGAQVWFSDVAPTSRCAGGVAVQQPLDIGFRVVWPAFTERGKQCRHWANGPPKNAAMDAFPVIFPWRADRPGSAKPGVFFPAAGGRSAQLSGGPDMRMGRMRASAAQLGADVEHADSQLLTPVKVLLSTG